MSGSDGQQSVTPLHRRAFLRRAAALSLSASALGAILAACGSSPGASTASSPGTTGATAATSPNVATGSSAAKQPTTAAAQATGKPKRGGTLRAVVVNDWTTMWPVLATGPAPSVCYDWLVRWRKG